MSLKLTFKKIAPTEALKTRVQTRIEKFEKYVNYPMEVHVHLTVEKPNHMAEVTCYAEHRELVAVAKTKNLYEAIDLAVKKIESQLKKEREKRKGHARAHLINRPTHMEEGDLELELPHAEKRKSTA